MDKNTGLYIVFGFLLLCILLSLDKKEGFVTINSDYFCMGNSDANTCNISLSGSTGYICQNNENNVYYTESTTDGLPRNLASGSFNITATGCSDIGYLNGEEVSASPCSHSGEEYTLSGCSPKCVMPSIPEYYNLNSYSLPTHISPEEGNDGIIDTTMTCNNNMGYYDAVNVCFYRDTGDPSFSQSSGNCLAGSRPGIWYDSTGGNGVKLVCNTDSPEYKIIGCEQGCLSRIRDTGEYYTLDDTDRDKEIVQILDRSDDGTTTLKKPSSTLYNVTENNITPSSEFSVDVTGGETTFKSDPSNNDETGIPVNFGGQTNVVGCSARYNTDYRKYIVNGLFPICNAEHECLNFSVDYRSVGGNPTTENIYNINDFKDHLRDNIGEIIGGNPTAEQIEDYINSLYYYRRYIDGNGYIHIEGQLRCDTDVNSPFYCEIGETVEEDPSTNQLYIQNGGYCYNPIFDPEQTAYTYLNAFIDDRSGQISAYMNDNPYATPRDWWDSINNSAAICALHNICKDGTSFALEEQETSCYQTYYPSEWRTISGEEEPDPITWILGALNQSCDDVCGDSTCMIPDRDDIDTDETMRQKILDARGDGSQTECSRVYPWPNARHSINPDLHSCFYPDTSVNLQTYQCERIYTSHRPLCKCQG